MQPFAKNMAVEFADKAIPGGEIDGIFAQLREAIAEATDFVGIATIVENEETHNLELNALPTEIGFYKVVSEEDGYQGIMYVKAVGESASGVGMCVNGKYFNFSVTVALNFTQGILVDGEVEITQTGPSTYSMTLPTAQRDHLYFINSKERSGLMFYTSQPPYTTAHCVAVLTDGTSIDFDGQPGYPNTISFSYKPIRELNVRYSEPNYKVTIPGDNGVYVLTGQISKCIVVVSSYNLRGIKLDTGELVSGQGSYQTEVNLTITAPFTKLYKHSLGFGASVTNRHYLRFTSNSPTAITATSLANFLNGMRDDNYYSITYDGFLCSTRNGQPNFYIFINATEITIDSTYLESYPFQSDSVTAI